MTAKRKPKIQPESPWENRIVGYGLMAPDTLIPNPDNWRTHSKHQGQALEEQMDQLGWVQNVVVNKTTGRIVDGHLRAELALKHGVPEVPVTIVELSEAEEALALATLDPVSALAGSDKEKLDAVLRELPVIDGEALNKLIADNAKKAGLYLDAKEAAKKEALAAAEEARAALVEHYGVAQGQLWRMGPHRLLCGDSTDPDSYRRLMGVERAACLFTDPPYGVDYEADSGKFEIIANDELKYDDLAEFLTAALRPAVKCLSQQGAAYIWHASSTRDDFSYALKACGLEERQYLIWAKPAPVLGWGDYQWGHEPCFYCSHAGESPMFYGARDNQTVWRIAGHLSDGNLGISHAGGVLITDGHGHQLFVTDKPPKGKKPRHVRLDEQALILNDAMTDLWEVSRTTSGVHPTEKPAELARKALENSTQPDEIVLDPFGGSGSTLVGAIQAGRRARVIELMPAYAAVILARAEEMGLTPEQEA